MDRIRNALTYRIFGEETAQDGIYETYLADYEKKTVRANLWGNTMEPLYEVIAMTGAFFIIVHGGRTSGKRAGLPGTSLPSRPTLPALPAWP